MSHICYLFEGLTFSLWFGAFAPCRSGIDFTMPPKVAVRRIAIGRCVANCRKYALSPRPRGRFSPVGNENRGHPTAASYLCIGKSSQGRKGAAGLKITEPCGATDGTKERQAKRGQNRRQSLCRQSAVFCHRLSHRPSGVQPVRKSCRLADNGSMTLDGTSACTPPM